MSKLIAALVTASLTLNLGMTTPVFGAVAADDKKETGSEPEKGKGEKGDKKKSDDKYDKMWPKPGDKP